MARSSTLWKALACAAGAAVAAGCLGRCGATGQKVSRRPKALRGTKTLTHIETSRRFNHGSALLAASVLLDSSMEHYRGDFLNTAMYLPPAIAICSLGAGLHGGVDRHPRTHTVRHAIYWTAVATGLLGSGFHLYNVTKRPGGWSWQNLFWGAPLGAPGALLLSGALGAAAERLRNRPAHSPRLMGLRAGRALGLLSGIGLAATAVEAALLHFRGSFQHKAMYLPVSVPPVAAIALLHASLSRPTLLARMLLRATFLLGWLGTAFHVRGVARHHGGWRNWSQNLFNGPPVPAPPAFTALAMTGLAALRLREREHP
jgi:hypothetical protein